jgi:hypothetical protein
VRTDDARGSEPMHVDDVTSCVALIGLGVALLVVALILGDAWVWPILGFVAGALVMLGLWRSESHVRSER